MSLVRRKAKEADSYGKKHSVLLGALLLEHLTETSESSACGLSNDNLRILKSTLNERPKTLEMRLDEERATLDDDTESSDSGLSEPGIGGRGEGSDLFEERREDLSGREGGSENVDDPESGTSRNVVVDIEGLRFGTDGKEGSDD